MALLPINRLPKGSNLNCLILYGCYDWCVRPIFTIHAGELLAGSYIEAKFKNLNVWIPSKDTGVDLLVTDKSNRKTAPLQVKFSKDFLPGHATEFLRKNLVAWGWWTFDLSKLKATRADLWVLVSMSFGSSEAQYVVIPSGKLYEICTDIHGHNNKCHVYLTVTRHKRCWATRGLSKDDMIAVAKNEFTHEKRDFSQWLNNWKPLENLSQ